jgi:hypothetical protein
MCFSRMHPPWLKWFHACWKRSPLATNKTDAFFFWTVERVCVYVHVCSVFILEVFPLLEKYKKNDKNWQNKKTFHLLGTSINHVVIMRRVCVWVYVWYVCKSFFWLWLIMTWGRWWVVVSSKIWFIWSRNLV